MSYKYRVIGLMGLALPAGMPVRLTEAQLKARAHQVLPVDAHDGFVFSEQERLQFKRGEEIELLGELPKGQVVNGIVEQIGEAGEPVPLPPPSEPTAAPGQRGKKKK